MTIKETLNLILETRDVLISDYTNIHGEDPTNEDLLLHVKKIIKEGNADELLESILLEEDIEDVADLYKLLLLTAASVSDHKD